MELIKQNCKSHELRMLNLYLLMYTDDMVLFSESIHELQNIVDVVNLYSKEYDLYINLSKTKIVIFRNRGTCNCKPYMLHMYQTMIQVFHGCNNHLVFY
jgi:hypothetical protein